MRRREFIASVGAAAAWPVVARGQQSGMPVVGFLHPGSAAPAAEQAEAFRGGLAESGIVIGRDATIEYRWAGGQYARLPEMAAELVERRVALLMAGGGPAAIGAAKTATATIPIVFVSGDDPVK